MTATSTNFNRIQPYSENPYFWELDGKPILLLGGSLEDNLFQIDELEAHLDALVACGGNYVRSTLSSRDEGNAWPFIKDRDTGLYDLEQLEGPFWDRFEKFVEWTRERKIIIQVEIFDRFDFARDPWQLNPFNPKNNINFNEIDSGLEATYEKHPSSKENPFFRSVPALKGNILVRRYQEAFVDRLLAVTLGQPHVLYCISNETNESPEWGKYWAKYIRAQADQSGDHVYITEMWDAHNLDSDQHRNTWMHPDTYDFVDISQVNHQVGWNHWESLMSFRRDIAETGRARPLNMVKIYGANSGFYGTTRDAQERFWRNIFAGLASTRFHRPPIGLGLSAIARTHIRSARMLAEKIDLFAGQPLEDCPRGASRNEAYVTRVPGFTYAVFFPDGGQIQLDMENADSDSTATLHWLDIRKSIWLPPESSTLSNPPYLSLNTPTEEGYWACVLTLD